MRTGELEARAADLNKELERVHADLDAERERATEARQRLKALEETRLSGELSQPRRRAPNAPSGRCSTPLGARLCSALARLATGGPPGPIPTPTMPITAES